MANNYKCELSKESLDIRVEFGDMDRNNRFDEMDSEDENSDFEDSWVAGHKTFLINNFCFVVGSTEYQLKFVLSHFDESDNVRIQLDMEDQDVAQVRLKELFLKVQGEKQYSHSEDEVSQGRETISILHTKDFPNVIRDGSSAGKFWQCTFKEHDLFGHTWTQDKFTGWFLFTFETTKALQNFRDFNLKTMKHFSILKSPIIDDDFDFEIIAEGKEERRPIKFHKLYLGQLSEYFKKLFDHPRMVECETRKSVSKFNRKTIKIFHNLLYKQNLFKEDITIDLLKFADYYMIHTLYSFCSDHFKNHVSEDNLIDLIKIGTLKNDNALLQGCADYFRKTDDRAFFKSKIWKNFMAENKECMFKIMEVM